MVGVVSHCTSAEPTDPNEKSGLDAGGGVCDLVYRTQQMTGKLMEEREGSNGERDLVVGA